MNYPGHPSYSDDDYEGCVTAGRATGRPIPSPSEEDLRRAEEAWNDPAFYDFVKDDVGGVTAGYVPKPTVDPNRTLVPSREEIGKLPRWAQVAFAGRCACRVLPLFKHDWPNAQNEDVRAVARAVAVAERAAGAARINNEDAAYTADIAFDIAHDSDQARDAVFNSDSAAHAAAHAARAAAYAGALNPRESRDAHDAVRVAVMSLCRIVTISTIGTLTAPARDFDRLCQLAKHEKWTDDTPVPPSVFGPMWEGPPPEWWTDDVLAGLPPEPAVELNKSGNQQAAPVEDATQPK